ncbi:amidase family protein [Aquipuribacter nitratireducens]|uniref:Amidase family protein n=1 Tax=Aquipuribacter nitratireducens TaxID=650104 RepID=A0ABW0GR64_9MICO
MPGSTRRPLSVTGLVAATALALAGVGGVALPVAARDAATSAVAPPAPSRPALAALDLETATAVDLQQLMTSGGASSEQVVRAYLDRIALLNTDGPGLNAVRSLNPDVLADARARDRERRRGDVRGPLHGVPVLIKDNIDLAGSPTTAGSIALEDSYPAGDAPLVTALESAGAVVLGKTNLSEFANFTTSGMPSGYSSLGGQVLNPYDASVTPSGSSSGTGAGIAAGLAPMGIGTETSGSILSPAQANSLAAVKPIVGLISRTGVIPISATQDTAGPMTTTVTDSALLLSALVSVDPEDPATAGAAPYVDVDYAAGLSTTSLEGARLGVVASSNPLFTDALAALEAEGATLVPVTVPNTSAPGILFDEFERDIDAYLARLPESAPMDSLTDIVAFNEGRPEMKFGQTILVESESRDLTDPAQLATYEANRDRGLAESRASIDGVLAANDLDAIVSLSGTTGVGARAGYPSVSVPAGYSAANGRPSNVVFLGTAWSEATLLSLAYDYEQATLLRRPPSIVNPTLFQCLEPVRLREASCAP